MAMFTVYTLTSVAAVHLDGCSVVKYVLVPEEKRK